MKAVVAHVKGESVFAKIFLVDQAYDIATKAAPLGATSNNVFLML